MGSYWSLNVKKLNILSGKSYVWPEIGVLFRDDEWCSEWIKNDGIRYKRYLYRTTAGAMAARLDLSGHDLASAKATFKRELKELVRERQDVATRTDEDGTRNSPYAKAYDVRTLILSRHTFSRWSKSFSEIVAVDKEVFSTLFYTPEGVEIPTSDEVCPETEHLIRATAYDDDIHLGFPSGEYLPLLRSICAAVNPNESIELNFTDLVNGGYCRKRERFYDSSLQQLSHDYLRVSPIIILTEGSSDAEILKLSLAVLFPHLTQMIRFMDFSSSNAAGGASALVSQVRAFAGSGIQNRIIALFDNDVAATTALTGLPDLLLDNIKVIRLPNLRRLRRYP